MMRHHAFAIEAVAEEGIATALAWAKRELGMEGSNNPDLIIFRYGFLSVENARNTAEVVASTPFAGENKVIIIAANRIYHEAQNALLKLFEEPPDGTYLFLVIPSLGGLLPTLRSRVHILLNAKGFVNPSSDDGFTKPAIPQIAGEFIKADREKRSAMIRKIAAHDDGDAVSSREEALAIVNGIEALVYAKQHKRSSEPSSDFVQLLKDIAILRGHLHDRSAPVKMILEHISIVTPQDLL